MRVSCPSCQTNYNIDDKRIPPGGAKLKCSKCQTLFPIKPGGSAPASAAANTTPSAPTAVPLPSAAAAPAPAPSAVPLPRGEAPAQTAAAEPSAIPLPGISSAAPASAPVGGVESAFSDFGESDGSGDWNEDATRVATLPLPDEALPSASDAVPLPGIHNAPPALDQPHVAGTDDAFAEFGGTDFGGSGSSSSFGDSEFGGGWQSDEDSTRVASIPIPEEALPGASHAREALPLPSWEPASTPFFNKAASAALPLPGLMEQPANFDSSDPFGHLPESSFGSDDGESWDDGATRVSSIPLPKEAFAPAHEAPVPLPPAAETPAVDEFSFDGFGQFDEQAQTQAQPQQASHHAVPLPAGHEDATSSWQAPAPAPSASEHGGFDFSDFNDAPPQAQAPAPAPAPEHASDGFDFSDFSDLPSPSPANRPAAAPVQDEVAEDARAAPPSAPSDDFNFEDFGDVPASASASSVPLPGSAAAGAAAAHDAHDAHDAPASDDFDFADFGDIPSAAGAPASNVPLPGSATSAAPAAPPSDDFNFADFGDLPSPAGAPASAAPAAPAAPPADDFNFADFGDLPSPAGELPRTPPSRASAAPAAPPSDDFNFADFGDPSPQPDDAVPPPPPPAAFNFDDFADLPSPAGASPRASAALAPPPPPSEPARAPEPVDDFGFDFADLPSPAGEKPPAPPPADDDFGFDFGSNPPSPASQAAAAAAEPAAPVDYSASFGDVDFGDPAPAPSAPAQTPPPAQSSGGFFDELEFDPTRKPSRPADDLEVDLAAPLPPPKPASAVDGLEMLSFIDESNAAAGERSTKTRYQVRRRSGKVFGPFEEGVIVKMLEDGQLLGNEDVSLDNENWSPIGTVGAFGPAMKHLMESPAGNLASTTTVEAPQTPVVDQMERLKNLYEGRMAAVTVVDRRGESQRMRKRLPLFIALGVLVLAAGAGGSFGFTRYGAFGLKVLLPSKVNPGTPAFTQLEAARSALLADTFKSYTEAREVTATVLGAKEFPEVRAVWVQSVFYLQRRYNAATPDERRRATEALPHIRLLGEKHPEVVKALAGEALSAGRHDEARELLQDGSQRHPGDLEMKMLLAEAWTAQNQIPFAVQALESVLERDQTSAKALHALGVLTRAKAEKLANSGKRAEAEAEARLAEELFEKALAAAPDHVISAVELAGIQLLVLKNPEEGLAALEKALAKGADALLGPAELARAHALNGTGLAMQFKVEEAIAEFQKALELNGDAVFAKAQLGRLYLSRREHAKAVPLFKEASREQPSNLDYVDGYLTVLVGTGMMQDALNVLESATAQFPDTPRITYLDARVNDALDNPLKAEENYRRALEQDPSLYEANLHLGRLYLRKKRDADARKQMEEAMSKAPQSALAHSGMGEVLLAEGQTAQARAAFERAGQIDPLLPDVWLGLSRAALLDGDMTNAEAHVDRALELDAAIPGGHLQKGVILWKKGSLPEAIAALEAARKAEPSKARVNVTLGAVKLDMNDLSGAEASLLAALSQEPRNAEANFYRARVKSRRMEHTQAIESMRAALESSKTAAYHYEMGIILRDAKKPQEAAEEWKKAIALDPKFADAMEALGLTHLDRGEFKEAIHQFESALRVDPTRARLLGAIGDAYFQSAEWDMAIRRYQQALRADGKLIALNYKIARSLSEQGRAAQAAEWYRKATAAEPENPMPWYYLGFLHKEKRQRAQAITAFTNYLKRKPDAADRREIEDEIYDLEQGI